MDNPGKLYMVPTPIGNLGDITVRAIEILRQVDVILAEDTRTSQKLLRHYDIHKPMQAHHQFNEHRTINRWVERILSGEQVAMISDAGTPGISDPGFLLIRACRQAGVDVECLPGPTALIPALLQSGLPADRFVFEGFLPVKKGRKSRINALVIETKTMILYESPFRLVKTLTQLAGVLGPDRRASVSRELTKIHEETLRGTLEELIRHFTAQPPKGEIVIVIEGKKA